MQHGSNLEACVGYLLEDPIPSEEASRQWLVAHGVIPPIDISEELRMLLDAQVLFLLPLVSQLMLCRLNSSASCAS